MTGLGRVTRLDVLERQPLDTVVAERCGIRWVRVGSGWINSAGARHTSAELFGTRSPLRVIERPAGLF